MSHDHIMEHLNASGHLHDHMNHGSADHSMDHGSMNHGGHSEMDHMAQVVASDPDSMSHHSMHGMHDMPGMMMAFHFGYDETILFECWKISTLGGLIGSMIGIIIMAALYEGLKYYREYLFWKTYNTLQYRSVTSPQEKNVTAEDGRVVQPTMLSWMHTFQTFLHIIQIILSYFLMLIFMTYNVWLCIAVVFGAAIGYFLFGWKKSVIVDVTEHCH
ncbi:Similar to SLC31A1: High affinity copper uptake protein 1 (Sus scrofa) [Cotesia congregata]|uniref:Copper transport protein n=1 Tax=Cotesia congregata TaxID=51543 RepID=A0A8J2HDT0_COTCN|nr:Similar to SLC31A1: High affinity copper uptake protein 1 (Sus scrofa) [Cotesia congregata]